MVEPYMTIQIPVKPYVGHYLRSMYGNPVVFGGGGDIPKYFYFLLKTKPNKHSVKLEALECQYRTDKLIVSISEDDYQRYGSNMTDTASSWFNCYIEASVRQVITISYLKDRMNGTKKIHAIRNAQELLGFSEDLYSEAAIKMFLVRSQLYNQEKFTGTSLLKMTA